MLNLKRLVDWLSGTGQEVVKPQADAEERRRFQRLQFGDCLINIGDAGPFSVTNLSYGGFRVDLSSWNGLSGLKTGSTIDCCLKMQNVQMVCQIIVRNLFKTFAGCAFAGLTPTQSRIVSEFIKPRVIGLSLREIDTAKLKNDNPELQMRWFQGDDGAQVFLWQTVDGENIMQEFYFLDYFMRWEKATDGLLTGKIGVESRSNFGRISPDSVAFFRIPPHRALKLGRIILECSKLPPEARDKMLLEIASEEKRLFHRFIVKDAGVVFIVESSPDQAFPVLNISLNGMALFRTGNAKINDGDQVNGFLKIGNDSIKGLFKPAYTHENILGGSLIIAEHNDLTRFAAFLAPRLLAQYLEEAPAPAELPAFAPAGARTYLYTGLHNTHILSLIDNGGKLLNGRIAFMDQAVTWRRGTLMEYHCPEGLIFPGEWELESAAVQTITNVEPVTVHICREMTDTADLAPEVKKAWLEVLSKYSNN